MGTTELRIITTGTSYELFINRGDEVGEQVEKKRKEKKKKNHGLSRTCNHMGRICALVNSSCAQQAPPPATAGHLPAFSVPGVGHLQILRRPGAGHLPTPALTPSF